MYHVSTFFDSFKFQILGPIGYYTFIVLYLLAIWGVQIGTLVIHAFYIPYFSDLHRRFHL